MGNDYEIECEPFPRLRLYNFDHPSFTLNSNTVENVYYEIEEKRGYASMEV